MENNQKSQQLSLFLSDADADLSQHVMSLILNNCDEGIVLSDGDNKIIAVNSTFTKIMGFSAEEVIGAQGNIFRAEQTDPHFFEKMWEELKKTGCWEGEIWVRRKNGEAFPEWLVFNIIHHKRTNATYHLAIFSDISERKASVERIQFLTHHDPLTNLPNRFALTGQLTPYLKKSQTSGKQVALLLINLDHFTNINLSLGLTNGDMALRLVAARLANFLTEPLMLARLGGDEFAVLVPEVKSLDSLGHLAKTILAEFKQPFSAEGLEFRLSASIGISVFPNDAKTLDDLVSSAHTSLQHAKKAGRNNYKFSTLEMQTAVRERLTLEDQLRDAIEQKALLLYYQPLVNLNTGSICAVEALARWHPSKEKAIPPNIFIPIAEETGLIIPLTDWALERACIDSTNLSKQGISPPPIAVNISSSYFIRKDFKTRLTKVFEASGITPGKIKLELTESVFMQNIETVIKIFAELKVAGVRVALDDFGTGYSSLSYIKYFSFDLFKIDISFIRDLATSEHARTITRAIINLAKNLNFEVVAEGVETQEQVNFLRENNCDIGQGYYFSKPLALEELTALLKKNN